VTNLSQAMETAGLTISELARRCRVSRQAVYMARRVGPSVELARRAGKALGVDWWLLIEPAKVADAAAWNAGSGKQAVPVREVLDPVREPDDGATE